VTRNHWLRFLFNRLLFPTPNLLKKGTVPAYVIDASDSVVGKEREALTAALRKMAPHERELHRRFEEAFDANERASDMPSYRRAEELGQQRLIDDVIRLMKKLKVHESGYAPGYLLGLYVYRAQACRGLGDFEKSIEYATEAIRLYSYESSGGGEHVASTKPALMNLLVGALMYRGTSSERLGRFEDALADYRGVCAAIRLVGLTRWCRQPSIHAATTSVLRSLAKIKNRDEAPRPHYSESEREAWQKELGIGDYSYDKYMCANCGATRSDSVKLLVCTACKKKWFCSKKVRIPGFL